MERNIIVNVITLYIMIDFVTITEFNNATDIL